MVSVGVVATATPAAATVPGPTPTTAVVTVKVGGDRNGTANNNVAPLKDVQLGLFSGNSSGAVRIRPSNLHVGFAGRL